MNSDMSFKQAKEIIEKIELTELSLKQTIQDVETSCTQFNTTLKQQERLIQLFPKLNFKLNTLILVVGINIGFIIGIIVGKYIL